MVEKLLNKSLEEIKKENSVLMDEQTKIVGSNLLDEKK